jgi:hypothetical protein
MKLNKSETLKMDYSNAELRIVDDRLYIIERDKDGNITDKFDLMEELEKHEGFLEEIGFKISIARTYGK